MELVSVIITTYKRNEFLERAINSVLKQSYRNIEILIVDDSGIEGAKQLTEDLAKLNGNIKYYSYGSNRGLAYARNYGMTNALGDFIAFLDDDDEWKSKKIQSQVSNIGEYDLVYCAAEVLKHDGTKPSIIRPINQGNLKESIINDGIGTISSSFLFKKNLVSSGSGINFDVNLASSIDHDFWMQLAREDKCVIGLSDALVTIYDPGMRLTMMSSFSERTKGIFQFIEKWEQQLILWAGAEKGSQFVDNYFIKVCSKLSISLLLRGEFRDAYNIVAKLWDRRVKKVKILKFYALELLKSLIKKFFPSCVKNLLKRFV